MGSRWICETASSSSLQNLERHMWNHSGSPHSDLSPPPPPAPARLHRCLCTEASSVGGMVGSGLGTHFGTT
ncbi:hypothetical protein PO909_010977 [Leuciscus waleckii]